MNNVLNDIEKKNPNFDRKTSIIDDERNVLNMKNYGSISSVIGRDMQVVFDEKNRHSFKAQLNELG